MKEKSIAIVSLQTKSLDLSSIYFNTNDKKGLTDTTILIQIFPIDVGRIQHLASLIRNYD